METFSALLAICVENSLVPGEFPTQRPVTQCFGVFFDLHLNKELSKQSGDWWFETLSRPVWRHCNVFQGTVYWNTQSPTCVWNLYIWNHSHILQGTMSSIWNCQCRPCTRLNCKPGHHCACWWPGTRWCWAISKYSIYCYIKVILRVLTAYLSSSSVNALRPGDAYMHQ